METYLSQASPEAQVPLFRDLLHLDLEYRRRRGDEPERRSYHRRFPELAEVVDLAFASWHTAGRSRRDRTASLTGPAVPP